MKTANNTNNKSSEELASSTNASASGSGPLERPTQNSIVNDRSINSAMLEHAIRLSYKDSNYHLSQLFSNKMLGDFGKLFRAYVPIVRMSEEEIKKYTGEPIVQEKIEDVVFADGKIFSSYVPLIQLSEEEIKKYTKKTE